MSYEYISRGRNRPPVPEEEMGNLPIGMGVELIPWDEEDEVPIGELERARAKEIIAEKLAARAALNASNGVHAASANGSSATTPSAQPASVLTSDEVEQLAQAARNVASVIAAHGNGSGVAEVYSALHHRYHVSSYRELPATKFDEAVAWLREWYRELQELQAG